VHGRGKSRRDAGREIVLGYAHEKIPSWREINKGNRGMWRIAAAMLPRR
jgi:hypothetical protein